MKPVARIVGIGTWLSSNVRDNSAWPEEFRTRKHGERTFNDISVPEDPVAAAIVARDLSLEADDPFLGSILRRVADDSMTAAMAEALAASDALLAARMDPKEIDLILGNAMVPDRVGPMSGPAVAHLIGAKNAQAISVDTVCASALSQLEIARAYIESGLAKNVLLVQSHLILRTVPMSHPASPGLGDCATAMVVSGDPSIGGIAIRSTYGVTHGEEAQTVTWIRGSDDETDTVWWKSGGPFRLGSRSPERVKYLMRDTVMYGSSTIRTAAERAGIDVSQIGVLVSVQPRGFLPPAIAEHLGLLRTAAVETYGRIAHVGVCGPVYNLEEARKSGRLQPGTIVAMYAQGAGFTRVAAILEV